MPAVLVEGTHSQSRDWWPSARSAGAGDGCAAQPGSDPRQSRRWPRPTARCGSTPVADPGGLAAHASAAKAVTPAAEGDRIVLRQVPRGVDQLRRGRADRLGVRRLAARPERLKTASASPFRFGKESYSRRGNIEGSIADGDPTTWRVTFDGSKREEDWFAVERAAPVTIDTVTVAHGRVYHDGGWWDACKGKPRIQVRKTPGGAWEDVAVIDRYPETTATDSQGLAGREGVRRTVSARSRWQASASSVCRRAATIRSRTSPVVRRSKVPLRNAEHWRAVR